MAVDDIASSGMTVDSHCDQREPGPTLATYVISELSLVRSPRF